MGKFYAWDWDPFGYVVVGGVVFKVIMWVYRIACYFSNISKFKIILYSFQEYGFSFLSSLSFPILFIYPSNLLYGSLYQHLPQFPFKLILVARGHWLFASTSSFALSAHLSYHDLSRSISIKKKALVLVSLETLLASLFVVMPYLISPVLNLNSQKSLLRTQLMIHISSEFEES